MVFALEGAQESVWILYENLCSLKVQELRLSIFVLGYERIEQIGNWIPEIVLEFPPIKTT